MALSIVAGTSGLIQLGLSISDVALLVDLGKKFGNFVRAGQNDNDLFDVLAEDREALLVRRGLVDAREMEKKWPQVEFVHQGVKKQGRIVESLPPQPSVPEANKRRKKKEANDGVDSFTWVMVAVVTALDECLPSSGIQELLIQVFTEVLNRDDDIATALRITIKKNIESWRSFGCAREIASSVKKEMRKSLSSGVHDQPPICAIPQMNEAETADMRNMLVWLLRGDSSSFSAMSPLTFSIVEAWKKVKLDLCIDGNPAYEGQACVAYHDEGQLLGASSSSTIPIPRGLGSRPLQISWPRDKPESMIDALGVGRALEDVMSQAWQRGKDAADNLELIGKADAPYESRAEVYYTIEVPRNAHVKKKYDPHIGMLADQGFPVETEAIHKTLEWILQREPADSSR